MSKEVDALTIELLRDIVKNQEDKYWRYYMMWHHHSNLADDEPEKFTKLEKESGSAMWDDPPEDWSERDLYIWSKGYARGRCVETGNISGLMRHIKYITSELIDSNYGFREGMPTAEQVDIHSQRHIAGFWMILIDNKKNNSFVPIVPMLYCLQEKKGKIQYWDDKWKNLTKTASKNMISFMPMTGQGIPASWESLKPWWGKKGKKDGN